MEKDIKRIKMPEYIADEIKEYIEQTGQGRCRCMKWENIRALLRLAMANNRLTIEEIEVIEKKICREYKSML